MRIRELVLTAALAVALAAGSALAQGNSGCDGVIQGGGGETSCNAWGLCKAYFSGSEMGRAKKHSAPPFQALIDAACGACGDDGCECTGDDSCDDAVDMCVGQFCPDTNPGGHGRDPSP
jgi:hypothetical protein